jgi:EAL domain-containing protein (putative c-di-GMP-specific phosphodiesterase class I)
VRSVGERPLCADDIVVTVSVGAVVFPISACSAEEAMARAGLAVAGAKASGRNHFELYALSAEQRAVQRRDLAIVRRVQDTLLEKRLEFAYQPIVRANWHQPAFYECLLRMRTPNNTLVPASQFIPVVEDSGLIRQIDRFALEKAMAELSDDPSANLAINVSGHTVSDRSWLNRLEALGNADSGLCGRLIVEITETTAMHSMSDAAYFVDAVRDLGARVALDDFGAGYSSFRHLKTLRVNMVKIDGLFTGKLAEHPDNMLFFHVLLRLAKGCGFETVAECAETSHDAVLLATAGVTYLQGYYFAKPARERLKGQPVLPLDRDSHPDNSWQVSTGTGARAAS